MKLPSWLRSFWSWVCVGFIVASVVFIVGGLSWLSWCYWWDCSCREWLVTGSDCRESGSTTLRNLGFVAGGLLAIGFGIWRGVVASRQAKTSQRGLLNERYQKGAEMLGSDVLAVRLGGIYELQLLVEDYPKQYHVQVMRLLSAFVRHPTKDEEDAARMPTFRDPSIKGVRQDVLTAMWVIAGRSNAGIELEEKANNFHLYLHGADLSYANLTGANLTGAVLFNVNLTGTILIKAKGLTQAQLEIACADPANPPRLDGLCDAETGNLLRWRGPPCRK